MSRAFRVVPAVLSFSGLLGVVGVPLAQGSDLVAAPSVNSPMVSTEIPVAEARAGVRALIAASDEVGKGRVSIRGQEWDPLPSGDRLQRDSQTLVDANQNRFVAGGWGSRLLPSGGWSRTLLMMKLEETEPGSFEMIQDARSEEIRVRNSGKLLSLYPRKTAVTTRLAARESKEMVKLFEEPPVSLFVKVADTAGVLRGTEAPQGLTAAKATSGDVVEWAFLLPDEEGVEQSTRFTVTARAGVISAVESEASWGERERTTFTGFNANAVSPEVSGWKSKPIRVLQSELRAQHQALASVAKRAATSGKPGVWFTESRGLPRWWSAHARLKGEGGVTVKMENHFGSSRQFPLSDALRGKKWRGTPALKGALAAIDGAYPRDWERGKLVAPKPTKMTVRVSHDGHRLRFVNKRSGEEADSVRLGRETVFGEYRAYPKGTSKFGKFCVSVLPAPRYAFPWTPKVMSLVTDPNNQHTRWAFRSGRGC